MRGKVIPAAVPAGSQAGKRLPGADFQTPGWVNRLMALRNRVVGLTGLKNLGHLGALRTGKSASEYRVGDRVGMFSLLHLSEDEVLLGDTDKHLDVVLFVCKAPQGAVSVSTVLHVHNWLGRLYMLPVTPLHKIIVKAMLKRTASLRTV